MNGFQSIIQFVAVYLCPRLYDLKKDSQFLSKKDRWKDINLNCQHGNITTDAWQNGCCRKMDDQMVHTTPRTTLPK